MEKKGRCAVFGCDNDRLFPEKYNTLKFPFCLKCARKCSAIAPWASHNTPYIKFNMAAVSVKRSYYLLQHHDQIKAASNHKPSSLMKESRWVPKALSNFQQIVGVEEYINIFFCNVSKAESSLCHV